MKILLYVLTVMINGVMLEVRLGGFFRVKTLLSLENVLIRVK